MAGGFPVSPSHVIRVDLQSRKKTSVGFTMLTLKNPNGII